MPLDSDLNPLLQAWTAPFGLPPFADLKAEHFAPAFEVALTEHRAEIDAIASNRAAPTFDNTIAALDRAGRTLTRISLLFNNLTASATTEALQAVEREIAPALAAHHNAIHLNAPLFARVQALHAQRESLALSPEQRRMLERVHLDFTLDGAALQGEPRVRFAQIVQRLAVLGTRFAQNVLGDEAQHVVWLRAESDLAGLPDFLRAAAREAATERGEPAAWAITLSRSMAVPFLTHSTRRDLRERVYAAWKSRGAHDGERDNRPIAREMLALRAEQARLMGYASYADFALIDRMAGTPRAVDELLQQVWTRARARAQEERVALCEQAGTQDIAPWDWRFYAEQVRRARYAIDDAELKSYFSLERMRAAAFDCANRLFGITFVPRADLRGHHPDVQVFEVRDRDGRARALFLSDNTARPGKRSGAWMSVYRAQSRMGDKNGADGEVLPIVVNNNNFMKPAPGAPTLLSADDVRTLFHEFGHGLHGMLSNVTYERLAGTRVLRDFVELPSQLFEHWAEERAVLKQHARHVTTGEPIPDALLDRLLAARQFNQGFETVGFVACALLDMAVHARGEADAVDLETFEAQFLRDIGLPEGCSTFHKLPHFQHLFSSSAYAAGYYVYMWAEVLDADGYDAFVEAGDPFAPEVAARLHKYIYSSGNSIEPRAAYRAFRGRDPSVEPLLRHRGLL
jgi:peptidyl-dipeptidase Dcp